MARQIVVADLSMSLVDVLAVTEAAGQPRAIYVIGLVLFIAYRGVAAPITSGLIGRFRWIAYLGLLIRLYVAFGDLGGRATRSRPWPAPGRTQVNAGGTAAFRRACPSHDVPS